MSPAASHGEHYYSLWIEDSPQPAAESFNFLFSGLFSMTPVFVL